VIGKVAYGALFVVVLPLLLVAWAHATASVVHLPVPAGPFANPVAFAVLGLGLFLILAGMAALWFRGGGLPMNAFPPARKVTSSVYAVVRHPIYVGFVLVCGACAVLARSSSGLYLVTPVTALAAMALVLGYEGHDLRARFGPPYPTLLSWPEPSDARPTFRDRAAVLLTVLVPWGLVYEAIAFVGRAPDAFALAMPFEARLPVLPAFEVPYASIYPLALLAPFVLPTQASLRRLAVRGTLTSLFGFGTYLLLPVVAPPRPFVPDSALGYLLQEERRLDTEVCAFPSFHATWIILAMTAFAARFPRLRALFYAYAALVCVACVATGMHSIADVLAGGLLAYAACRAEAIWELLRRGTERIANSWSELRVGRLRIINYAGYGALSTGVGVALALTFAGPENDVAILLCGVAAILGAGAWAQWIEGSSRLLRPYGFYGGLLGIILASFAAPLVGGTTWAVLGAFALSGPYIQAVGRLRCLVQGCCHGSAAPHEIGIRYTHPMSRVCRFSELGNRPVHPTPLYSILWNALTFVVLFRLATLAVPLRFLAGMYLVANGLGRFVEESYRGEPQTPIVARLRAYQWAALASLLCGGLLTALPMLGDAPPPPFVLRPIVLAYGLGFGLLTAMASGMDFPDSSRRFSRLS